MSVQQQQLWLLHLTAPDSPAYLATNGYELDGGLDTGALSEAVRDVVLRHAALRTTFHSERGRAYARLHPTADGLELTVVDVSGVPADRRDELLGAAAAEMTTAPMRIDRDLPIRARLLLIAPHRSILLLTWHHLVIDDWSARLIEADLAVAYAARAAGRPAQWPEPAPSYHDHVRWQQHNLADILIDEEAPAFWRTYLADAPPLVVPTDLPRDRAPTGRGRTEQFSVGPDLVRRLDERARKERTTLNVVALTAFTLMLREWCGTDDIVVGLPFATRGLPDADRMVGLLVNLIPVRTRLDGVGDVTAALRRVRASTLAAFEHHLTPFSWLVTAARPRRVGGHLPIVHVTFQLVADPPGIARPDRWGPLRVREWDDLENHGSQLDLDVTVQPDGARGLTCKLTYRSDLFVPATAQRLARDYAWHLGEMGS